MVSRTSTLLSDQIVASSMLMVFGIVMRDEDDIGHETGGESSLK